MQYNKKKKIIAALLAFLTAAGLTGCQMNPLPGKNPAESVTSVVSSESPDTTTPISQAQAFDQWLNQQFCKEVTVDTLTLHYTLNDPASYGITDYPITLGTLDNQELLKDVADAQTMLADLKAYPSKELSLSQQLTKDILQDYLTLGLKSQDYYLYQEPLNSVSGLQSTLPTLFSEYSIHSVKDVTDYLTLLADVPRFFDEIITFEQQKSDAGLFMADFALDDILEQCNTYSHLDADNFLITTFATRLDNVPNLSDEDKDSYIEQNRQLITETVQPAYEKLADSLEQLRGTGTNDAGLCAYPDGKDWYTMLLQSDIGCDDSPKELYAQMEEARGSDMERLTELIQENPSLLSNTDDYAFPFSDAEEMLADLQQSIAAQFPKAPGVSVSIKYVEPDLEEYLSPAFYLTSPIDDWNQNSIYINPGNQYEKLDLYTTLAHEGYPGHLYQTLMFHASNPDNIRYLLNYPGYVEGWATYVEMLSFDYPDMPSELKEALQLNRALTLNLYASADIGIHYMKWDESDTAEFFRDYGITNPNTIQNIYQIIIETPGNYPKYYGGYLKFEQLKKDAMKTYGSDYSDTAFHDAVLSIGPAPFYIIEKYLPDYFNNIL